MTLSCAHLAVPSWKVPRREASALLPSWLQPPDEVQQEAAVPFFNISHLGWLAMATCLTIRIWKDNPWERLPAIFFKFQFRNVEYSSGRNKTFLCYVLETQGKESVTSRGYLEDEHAAAHAEMAFFNTILPKCDSSLRYNITWYVSSSPCVTCADRITETLKKNKNLRLTIMVGRLFMWEEAEMQEALKKMKSAGCKLRIMKPQDFEYVWQNFVEQEEGEEAKAFVPWEDIQDNFKYYEEKLAEILQ